MTSKVFSCNQDINKNAYMNWRADNIDKNIWMYYNSISCYTGEYSED